MNRIFLDFEELSLVLQDQDAQLVQMALQLAYLRGKIESYQEHNSHVCLGHVYHKCRQIRNQIDELATNFQNNYLNLG